MTHCNPEPRKGPRMSSLPHLAKCPAFGVVEKVADRGSSSAADTGSATGRVIELWHNLGGCSGRLGAAAVVEEALQTARTENASNTVLADWDRVTHYALLYAQDPRNRVPTCYEAYGAVVPELQEAEVKLTLKPDPDDPHQEPVELVGHVDQIRRDEAGHLRVWDVKCGRAGGEDMTRDYALQLAAYALAATETLGETVLPGGIIRMRGYDVKRGSPGPGEHNVFFPVHASLEACRALLGTVAYTVGEFARGIVRIQPGDQCRYCPGGGPFECYRMIDEALDQGALS